MKPEQWIIGGDTGVSSNTIWAVMMGAVTGNEPWYTFNVPHDPSDFGRCYRLLVLFPEWRARLNEVVAKFPEWTGMVREWDRLSKLYERDHPTGRSDELYEAMQVLIDEGIIADGWVKTGHGSWERNRT